MPADFDRDGDVDVFLVNFAGDCVYYENRMEPSRRWSVIQLDGRSSNRSGVGARIRLTSGGRTQTREIHLGSGFLSSPPPEAHFGLGDGAAVDRIEVSWPSGERQTFENLETNRVIVIEEGRGFRYRAAPPNEREGEVEAETPTGRVQRDGDGGAPCASAI